MSFVRTSVNPRLLIIDDDVDLLMLLERVLNKEGYIVETAASLPEAEDILSIYTPNLVLLDININGEDGRKLSWKLKKGKKSADIKVIMMSGYDYSISRSILFGADDLVPKPLNVEYLLHQVQNLTKSSISSNLIHRE